MQSNEKVTDRFSLILSQAEIDQKAIDRLRVEQDARHEQEHNELRVVRTQYLDLEEKLRHEKEDAIYAISASQKKKDTATFDMMTKLHQSIDLKKRVFLFKKVQKKGDIPVGHPITKAYDSWNKKELTIIGSLHETPFLVLDFILAENDKPKNKYSLAVVGNSAFRAIIKPAYDYGAPFSTEGCDVRIVVRDFPTIDELQVWFAKNKGKILVDYIKNHIEAEAEYQEVVANCNTSEWERAYWQDVKDYYENNYSHGTEQPEYALACAELIKWQREA